MVAIAHLIGRRKLVDGGRLVEVLPGAEKV
jgi:hypothetical protein